MSSTIQHSLRPSIRVCLCWLLAVTSGGVIRAESIVNSKHNLSVSGPGTIKAATESEICIFCHTPHQGTSEAPLWNRYSSGAVYTPYSSSTAKATVGQPTGASKLCLSCHDGTVALGMVRSRPTQIQMAGSATLPPGDTDLATDLSDDHPVSFNYDAALVTANGQLHHPSTLTGEVRLESGVLECTACHDPHDNRFGDFLVVDNTGSALCTTCHDQNYWAGSSHQSSTATWNASSPDPWPHSDLATVADNACENCHRPHSAGSGERLLNYAAEEQNCYVCHNGNVASDNIQNEFTKSSAHPVDLAAGTHDPTEDPVNAARHVECVDCHNPHAARGGTASAPAASGALEGVRGIANDGSLVNPVQNQYEVCYRCHADSIDRGAALVNRQFVETNTRIEFGSTSASFHPITTTGQNPDVPSLISPWTTSSMMYCTDCHNNNTTSGPKGPHGSIYRPILERQLVLADGQSENSSIYALCYKCHSRTSILNNESFKEHNKHVRGEKIACTSCHDPHGVVANNHLINFNLNYVSASRKNGRLEFVDNGRFRGSCSLTCHGEDHDNESYKP